MEQEELTLIQRARANWLKHGDRNTYFFSIIMHLAIGKGIILRDWLMSMG
jgi:hypothetical protein